MTDLGTGHKYPVLIDGNPAPTGLAWACSPNLIAVQTDTDGVVKAHPIGTAESAVLSTSVGARSGEVTVALVDEPLVITFGDAEPV